MAIESEMLEEASDLEKYLVVLLHVDNEWYDLHPLNDSDNKPICKPIRDRFKVQNTIYMLGGMYKEFLEWSRYTITDTGPFSNILEDKINHLIQINLISEDADNIQLTKKGEEYASEIIKNRPKKMLAVFARYKEFVNDMSRDELLSYLYSQYPEMTKDSVTYQNLKPDIEEHIFRLLERRKITSGKTADLLDQPLHIVMEKMKTRGIFRLEP